jgi:serine/threonine protein kinase/tetratricopeptide (TPR) repeat protein
MESSTIAELKAAIGERYDIEGLLAEGGMGAVYTARNRSLGSRVAVKILPPEVAASAVRLARFKREAALAANLSHPHIVPVFEYDASDGFAYLVMPLVEGDTLADHIEEKGRLDYDTVHELIRQVAGALGFAHSRNVVHRDIKPANILLEEATGRWLLTDFGVAHVTDPGDTEITRTGVVIGTPAYMTPEQRWGGPVDGRSDLYSLAAVAYQALCGTAIDRLSDELARSMADIQESIRQAVPSLSQERARALASPLSTVREERPDSAEAWLSALAVEKKRFPVVQLMSLAAMMIVAFVAGWLAFRPNDGPVVPSLPAVAVLPFQIDVRGDSNDLATLLPQAFDWQLQYLPDHRVLGAEVRNEIVNRYGDTRPPLDTLLAVARRHGATLTVQGRVASSGDDITISVLVHDVADGRLVADADSAGPADSLDALVSGIVIKAFAERMAREVAGWSSSLPRGLDAINAYVQGDRDFRRGAYESAVERLDEVIQLDSTFAPAHFKRMLSLMLGLRPTQYSTHLWSAFEAASAYGEGLDPVSQQLLAGYELLLREGDVQGAEQALSDIVERYPRALEAWYLLGYVQFNLRAILGTSLAEARRAFGRAVDRDSTFASALWHLALISVLEDNDDAAQHYLERFLAVDSTSLQAQIAQTYDSLLYRGTGSTGRVLGSLHERSTGVLEVMSLGAGELRPPPGVRPIAREALNAFWSNAGSRGERQMAFRMKMAYLLARGRFASADSLLRDAEQMRVPRGELDRWIILSAVTPLPNLGDDAARTAAVTRLENAEEDRPEALWLVARWHLQNDHNAARPFVGALAEMAADTAGSTPLTRSLSMDIQARQHLAEGDTVRALSSWELATNRLSVDQLMFGLTASLWHLRLDRALVAVASGQPESALRIAGAFDRMAAVVDQVAWPEIMRLKAEAARTTNDFGLARRTYQELVELLEEANGVGLALREHAQRMLAELNGGSP